ncbi:MAG TPA: HD domain-containing protein [Candidatus Acidoferrales bacterium]|nr:HD domain-containing protein [Candidatus Acidoferrales bacterium]
MKTAYAANLTPDQPVTSFFVVHEKEIRATREGRKYLRLELGDRTGTVEARMWTGFEESASGVSRDDFVKVQARVELYRNQPQLILDRLRRAEPAEIDAADFFAQTTANVGELWTRLRAHIEAVQSKPLRQLLDCIFDDADVADRFRRAPAAKTMHHAYLGGLLEHVVSLCDLSRIVAAHYPEVDLDLLITAALLHDVAKIYELSYERGIGYTTEGQLLGHIVMAVEMVGSKMRSIEGFPPEMAAVVKHLIVSHHGQYEFGSPKLPMIREAVLFHYLDDIDSKMGAIRAVLGSERGEENWTDRSGALERRLLRADRYMAASSDGNAASGTPGDEPQQLSLAVTEAAVVTPADGQASRPSIAAAGKKEN